MVHPGGIDQSECLNDVTLNSGRKQPTVVLIRDQTCSVAKQVSVAVGWVKIEISLMAQLKGLTAKFKLM